MSFITNEAEAELERLKVRAQPAHACMRRCVESHACDFVQRQHESGLLDVQEFSDLKKVILDEARKLYEARETAKRRKLDVRPDPTGSPPYSASTTPLSGPGAGRRRLGGRYFC